MVVAAVCLIGMAALTTLVISSGMTPFTEPPTMLEQLAWCLALCAPLAVRRRFPVPVLAVIGVLFIVAQARQAGDLTSPSIVLFLAIYTVGAWERNRPLARWSRVAVIVAMFAWLAYALIKFVATPGTEFEGANGPLNPLLASVLYSIVTNLLFFCAAYWFGTAAWESARRQAELEHRAEQLKRAEQENINGAIVAERVRIARDLHDVVAHHVSVMGVQAGAARRVLESDPALAGDALRTVEDTARTAIGELRGLLGVLRQDDTAEEKHPGLEQIPELLDSARAAVLDLDYGVYGEPREVPKAISVSAYRVVQEALTNVVKHAAASRADVRVRYLDAALEVEVTDNGVGVKQQARHGFGLVGMTERVGVHGGEFESGPRRDGGYRVRASFPLTAPAKAVSR